MLWRLIGRGLLRAPLTRQRAGVVRVAKEYSVALPHVIVVLRGVGQISLVSSYFHIRLYLASRTKHLNRRFQTSTGGVRGGNSALRESLLNPYDEAGAKPPRHGRDSERPGQCANKGSSIEWPLQSASRYAQPIAIGLLCTKHFVVLSLRCEDETEAACDSGHSARDEQD